MSWEIIYKRQFIKLPDNTFILMIEAGSNNCYEAGGRNARRARSWWNHSYFTDNKLSISLEDLTAKLDAELEDYATRCEDGVTKEEISKQWGYYTAMRLRTQSNTTFPQYKAFYINGCKQAMTIEEMAEHNVYPDIIGRFGDNYKRKSITSTEDLLKVWEEWHKEDSGITNIHLTYDCDYFMDKMHKRLHKREKKPREYVDVKTFWVLYSPNMGYFVKNTRNGFKYSSYTTGSTKAFLTEDKAKKYHEKMRNSSYFEVKKIERDVPIQIRK